MTRLREIAEVSDPSTGMVLERVRKDMKGERFTADLVVNHKRNFNPEGYAYLKMGEVWILFGCPRAARITKGGKCRLDGKNAQVAQHVLYPEFRKAYAEFMRGDLQDTWINHRKKLRKLRRNP
jgi:hypothetical protein